MPLLVYLFITWLAWDYLERQKRKRRFRDDR